MSDEEKEHQFKARFPPSMWKEMESIAKDENRSINGTILQAMRDYIAHYKRKRRKSQEQEDV